MFLEYCQNKNETLISEGSTVVGKYYFEDDILNMYEAELTDRQEFDLVELIIADKESFLNAGDEINEFHFQNYINR